MNRSESRKTILLSQPWTHHSKRIHSFFFTARGMYVQYTVGKKKYWPELKRKVKEGRKEGKERMLLIHRQDTCTANPEEIYMRPVFCVRFSISTRQSCRYFYFSECTYIKMVWVRKFGWHRKAR